MMFPQSRHSVSIHLGFLLSNVLSVVGTGGSAGNECFLEQLLSFSRHHYDECSSGRNQGYRSVKVQETGFFNMTNPTKQLNCCHIQ